MTGVLTLGLMSLWSCAGDNVHQPEPGLIPEPKTYSGDFTSSIPVLSFFTPVTQNNTAKVTWQNERLSTATINVGAFDITINEMQMSFSIGEMEIPDVICTHATDGTISLNKPAFECQAGQYHTTGSLSGEINANGEINITLLYKPGSMPFEVKSTFSGK